MTFRIVAGLYDTLSFLEIVRDPTGCADLMKSSIMTCKISICRAVNMMITSISTLISRVLILFINYQNDHLLSTHTFYICIIYYKLCNNFVSKQNPLFC